MKKAEKRKVVIAGKRNWVLLVLLATGAGLVLAVGFWLLTSKSDLVKKKSLNQLSIMADRMDELSKAIKKKDRPQLNFRNPPPPSPSAKPEDKGQAEPAPQMNLTPSEPATAEHEVSPQDQEELRNFLKKQSEK